MMTESEMLDWLNKHFLDNRNGIACDQEGWYAKREPMRSFPSIRNAIMAAHEIELAGNPR